MSMWRQRSTVKDVISILNSDTSYASYVLQHRLR